MPPGNYDLVLDNKIGLATYTPITTAIANGGDPTATADAVTLIYGDSSYYIDVLANDTDADSDKMIIIPEEDKTSALGGRLAVSKGKIRYTPPRGVLPAAFPDTFTYTLDDGNGGVSATPATVTVTMNAITLDPIKHWDGTALGARTVQPGSRIIICGTDFGVRAPTVTLAYIDSKGRNKDLRLKIVSKAQYADYRGRAKRSYTDLDENSATFAKSEIVVELPRRAWDGYENSKVYTITVANRFDVSGADQDVNTSAGNTDPTATPDNVDIVSGEKYYYIDVLANQPSSGVSFSTNGVDADAESDKMTIVLPERTSTLGARLSVDRTTNTVKYIRVKNELCAFTDSFEYSLKDADGNESATVTVNITAHLK